jgi:hypothetical protein
MRKHLAELAATPPITITITAVSLIRLNRHEKVYRWDTTASVPFTGAG